VCRQYEEFYSRNALRQFLFGGLWFGLRTGIQASINTVDIVVVNSEWTADVVKSLFDREADSIIYPTMLVDSYSPDYRDDPERYYLYLGLIDEHHRIEEVVEAFNRLPY